VHAWADSPSGKERRRNPPRRGERSRLTAPVPRDTRVIDGRRRPAGARTTRARG
jgi:hypothetical protein